MTTVTGMEHLKKTAYLGDAVYIGDDGYHLVLFTHDGARVLDKIYLDPGVVLNFERYIKDLKEVK